MKDAWNRRIVRVDLFIIGALYLVAGAIQLVYSAGSFDDPSGTLPGDMVGSWVLLVISIVLLFGGSRKGAKARELRAFFAVGGFLSLLYGATRTLVHLSHHLSYSLGTVDESPGPLLFDLLEPSIVLAVVYLSLLIMMKTIDGSKIHRRDRP